MVDDEGLLIGMLTADGVTVPPAGEPTGVARIGLRHLAQEVSARARVPDNAI